MGPGFKSQCTYISNMTLNKKGVLYIYYFFIVITLRNLYFNYFIMIIQAGKLIGAGAATIAVGGAGAGIG